MGDRRHGEGRAQGFGGGLGTNAEETANTFQPKKIPPEVEQAFGFVQCSNKVCC